MLRPLRLLWPPALIGALRTAFRQARDGRRLANDWARGAVERLVEEGSLDPEEGEKALRSLEAPETLAVLGHLGAHIAISVPLRFPFGSATRFVYVVVFRLRSEARALIRRESDEQLRGARKIHTLTVAVGSALPGVGTFAYLVAEPLRKNRPLLAVLLDEALRKLPFNLYRRQHLAVLTCWLSCSGPGVGSGIVTSRWHYLRPHHLVAWVRDAIENLRPNWNLVGGILAVNVVALIIAAVAFALTDNRQLTFGEFGPLQTLKAGQLLVAGVAGYYIYTRFWRLPQAEQRIDAPGSFFWILSGLGLMWLGIDDYFGLHERGGDFLQYGLGVTVPLLNNPDDIIVLGYGIIGLTVGAIFFGELLRSRATFPLLATGIGLLVVSLAVDFFAPEGSPPAGLEEPTNLIGAGFVLSAYLVKLREVWSELPAAPESTADGGLPSEP
ncbi:MAG: hypothetical protein RX317_08810 [bacterium]|nr:hypothetical protein [bacterium]